MLNANEQQINFWHSFIDCPEGVMREDWQEWRPKINRILATPIMRNFVEKPKKL